MRTIKESLLERLSIQAEEAEIQGLTKLASALTEQITKNSVRSNKDFYLYPNSDFSADIEEKLWDIVIRASDFYGVTFDSLEMSQIIDKYAQDLRHEICTKLGIFHGIGAQEPLVPGETFSQTIIEVGLEDSDGRK